MENTSHSSLVRHFRLGTGVSVFYLAVRQDNESETIFDCLGRFIRTASDLIEIIDVTD